MLGSCSSSCWGSSRRHGTTTSPLVRNVTARLPCSPTLPGRRLFAPRPQRLPCTPARRGTVRWLSSGSAREKKEQAGPSSSSSSSPSGPPQKSTLLLDPSTASSPHSSLDSFHAYARRTGLSPTSTVYAGTTYEYLAQETLRPYGFRLHRVGGRGDRGVDLVGFWEIPVLSSSGEWKEKKKNHTATRRERDDSLAAIGDFLEGVETRHLKVLVQCKRLVGRHARIGPNLVRELDGAVRAARSAALLNMVYSETVTASSTAEDGISGSRSTGSSEEEARGESSLRGGPAIGVLVGTRPATKGVVDSMSRSTRGLVWVMMEETVTDQDMVVVDESRRASQSESAANLRGRIKQILWNHAAREAGLEGVDVVKRYDSNGAEELVLMRGGRVWGGAARKRT